MKLRVFDNTLRLRLSETEVETLARTGVLENSIPLDPSGKVLRYLLQVTTDGDTPRVGFDQGTITVSLPERNARAWLRGDTTGISQTLSTRTGDVLLTVETDQKPY